MAALSSQQEKSLEAFVIALGEQNEPLPSGLQKQLHAIGQNLENRVVELPAIAANLPSLYASYQEAFAEKQADEGEQAAVLASSTAQDDSSKLMEHAAQIFTDPDPVQAAQKNMPKILDQVASNPLKRLFGRG
ncbi:MAG: hypothetical protein ACFBSF_06640 [Leptolyngbyaceae cyanobacterium]